MASISQQTIIIIVVTLVFAAVYGVLIWLIFVENGKLTTCETKQSVMCPSVLCNGDTTANVEAAQNDGRPSNKCFPYAYRLTTPDAKNEPGETNFECNFPLTGEMYNPT
jgi:hypothetical protein